MRNVEINSLAGAQPLTRAGGGLFMAPDLRSGVVARRPIDKQTADFAHLGPESAIIF
ncbi:hypothetical protein [Afipia birgiae]|jgi:hypothetical protein|uniref:hypothetical protein n=1 Tax=Afipia birgiae TaxID=151414 RepID=UPI0012E3756D|nr:hypothetical protein [Afipia birgiae]